MTELPYCGAAPLPGELWHRFNWDPVIIAALCLAVCLQLWWCRRATVRERLASVAGWSVAAAALLSPLCALSVALLSARIGQHMILALIAAPLIALGMAAKRVRSEPLLRNEPIGDESPLRVGSAGRAGSFLWMAAAAFFFALWFWHMPWPYEATFTSVAVYWCMHVSLFGSAIWLWYALLHHPAGRTAEALLAGALTSIQMGLLGATLSLAGHALFRWHLLTTWAFGVSPLEDQQLGGVVMWVPGIALFLWVAVRSLARLWSSLEGARVA
jgi:putative membrane protein